VVIIDDLAYLRRGRNRNVEAAHLMRKLRELKDDKGLSILVIARTRTRATLRGTVTLADLEGSAEITGFADNIFAIGGQCADPGLRYLKHIKLRSTELDFDAGNVPTFRIEKTGGNFLSFRHVDYSIEHEIVRGIRDNYDNELMPMIIKLQGDGLTQRAVADRLGISKTTVNRYLLIYQLQQEALQEEREREEERQAKRQKPLSPSQQRDQNLFEMVKRQHEANLRRQAEAAAARGLPAPRAPDLRHCEPMTPSSVFRRPDLDDGKCDCTECLAGREKQCLEKALLTSRSP
jgi:transposase